MHISLSPTAKKWLWFVGLYLAGLATVSAVAYGIRAVIM